MTYWETARAAAILAGGLTAAGIALFNLDLIDPLLGMNTITDTMRVQESLETWEGPRPPVPGTVVATSRELGPQLPDADGWVTRDAVVAGRSADQMALISAHADLTAPEDPPGGLSGEALYNIHCVPCHGPAGEGDGTVPAAWPILRPPNLVNGAATGYSDGEIYGIIRVGRGRMPAYGGRVTPDERWRIVRHVRHLQGD